MDTRRLSVKVLVSLTVLVSGSFLFVSSLFKSPASIHVNKAPPVSLWSMKMLVVPLSFVSLALVSRLSRRRSFLRQTITVDGPAASGKGAVARLLAKRLNYGYMDTGSIYRAVGYLSLLHPHLFSVEIVEKLSFNESLVFDGNFVLPDAELRSEEAARRATAVGQQQHLRDAIRKFVRSQIRTRPFVIEGRDCGSVVVPEASRKFLLTADLHERTSRRVRQLGLSGEAAFAQVQTAIENRDLIDQRHLEESEKHGQRKVDCTWLSVDQTVAQLLE